MKIIYLSNSIGKKSNGGSSLSGLRFLELLESKYGAVTLVTDEWRSPPSSTESRTVKLARVDFIRHGHSYRQIAKLLIFFAINLFRRRTITVDADSEDVLLIANSFTTLTGKISIHTRGKVRKVCVVRGDTSSFAYQGWSGINAADPLAMPKAFLLGFDGIIYVSKTILGNWLAEGVHIPHWYLPNAIDEKEVTRVRQTPVANSRSRLGFAPNKCHIVVVGSLQERKGQDMFATIANRLFAEIPHAEVHFVGVISSAFGGDRMADSLRQAGQGHFIIHGHKDNALEFVHAADIVVSTSRSEAFPRTVAEYLAMGKPIISTRVAGADEMIEHQVNGMLIEIDDALALVDGLVYLARRKDICQSFGLAAEATYQIQYSETRQAGRFGEILDEIVRI